jgi:hypothetical protein
MSGLAVIGVSAIVFASVVLQHPSRRTDESAVAPATQAHLLSAPTSLTSSQPLDQLPGQQVNFHIDFAVDFVVTGAQLAGRIVSIPGRFLQDIQNGTPLPVAVSRAVLTFANVELDAGRELVRFAVQYADFQIRFVANLIAELPRAVFTISHHLRDVDMSVLPMAAGRVLLAFANVAPNAGDEAVRGFTAPT